MAQKEILSYRNWLLKNHIDQDPRIGDLAREVRSDRDFPVSVEWETLYDYVSRAAHRREAPVLALMESYVQYRDYVEDVLNGLRI